MREGKVFGESLNMENKRPIMLYLALVVLLLSLIIPNPLYSQEKAKLLEKYRRWLEEEVVYIITDAERDMFLALNNDEAREEFIKDFWLARDPTPGTLENEYKDEHYARIARANKLFRTFGPASGLKSDRGRIYILLGPPDERKMFPDPQWTIPLELWTYRGTPSQGLPAYFFLLFYQKIGVNDYKLYMPGFEPVQNLLRVHDPMEYTDYGRIYEELKTMAPELPMAVQSYLPEESLGMILHQDMSFSFSSHLLLNKIATVPHRLVDTRYVEKYLGGVVRTEYAFLTMVYRPIYFLWLDKSGNYFLDFSFLIEPQYITIQNYKEKYYTSFKVNATLQNKQREKVGEYGDRGDLYFTREQVEAIKNRPMAYLGRMVITPGKFNLSSQLANLTSNSMGRVSQAIDVLDSEHEPILMGMLPILRYQLLEEKPLPPGAFRTDLYALTPSWNSTFQHRGSGYLFFQMAFPENWAVDMEEKVLLKYELYQGDKLVKSWQKDPLNARKLAGAVLSIIEPLPLEELGLGNYRLRAFLAGQEGTVLLNGWSAFNVINDEIENPVVLTKPFPGLESMENSRERARLYYLHNENSKAAEMLHKILEFNPEDKYSATMMASIRMKQKNYEAAKGLLNQLLVKEPNDLALLKLAGECALEMNQYGDAVRFFERVRMQQPEELKNLNQLGLAYFALGQREKARELWERSLKLAPEQAEVRRLLQISQEAEQPENNGKEVVNLLNNKGL